MLDFLGAVAQFAVLMVSLAVIAYHAAMAVEQNSYVRSNEKALVGVIARHEKEDSELSKQAVTSRLAMRQDFTKSHARLSALTLAYIALAGLINTGLAFLLS